MPAAQVDCFYNSLPVHVRFSNAMTHRNIVRPTKILLLLGLLLGALGLAASALTWHGFTFVEWWREGHSGVVLWQAKTSQKLVALTFDDGPDPRYTPQILDTLRRYNVKA